MSSTNISETFGGGVATAHWSTRGMTDGGTKERRLPNVLSLSDPSDPLVPKETKAQIQYNAISKSVLASPSWIEISLQ